ncbi:MAG: endonuclease/exonuclease/phosphatase family protein [Thermoleophilia bacterium]|nr:endonuclease/exonuclease/phosphatase family protein [Thermoleophilia bacterium]
MQVLPNTTQKFEPIALRAEGQLRVGQLNAHNLFDTRDDKSTQEPISDRVGYKEHISKLATAIRDALGGPDIITMQEVENLKVLQDLVKDPAIKALGYTPLLREGSDPRGIDNAILYRNEAVDLVQVMQVDPQRMNPKDRGTKLFTRPPLVAQFVIRGREQARQGVQSLWVLANHFTSKLGLEDAALKRAEQATTVAHFAQGLQAIDARSAVIVAGDLNMERSEPEFAPLRQTKRGAALVDVTSEIPSQKRFSWRDGRKHVQFDQMLVSANLAKKVETVQIPHVSTRSLKTLHADPVRAEGFSDHDPIVTTFEF